MPARNVNKVVLITELLKLYDEAVTHLMTWKLRKWVIQGIRPTAYASTKAELEEWIFLLRKDLGK